MESRGRALVVEDDRAIRAAIEVALKVDVLDVRALDNGVGIEEVVAQFRPDIVILDVGLPEGPDGLTVARRIREVSEAPVLFLTAADGLEARLAGFAAGCDDYLVKPFAMAELMARIRALLRRAGGANELRYRWAGIEVDREARTVIRNDVAIELTRTEFDLLVELGLHRGKVRSKLSLLQVVWGYTQYDPNLVEVHISALRKKLEEHGPRVIHTVRGVGYVFRT
ncbi:MAG TPA: response regulator transcription factor [Acidimicrobiales bacterium]|nr:response regulator transcription factor [Acidimicrobiales bacterium]